MERGKKSVEFVKCGTCYGWILEKRVTRDACEKVVVDDDTGNLEKIAPRKRKCVTCCRTLSTEPNPVEEEKAGAGSSSEEERGGVEENEDGEVGSRVPREHEEVPLLPPPEIDEDCRSNPLLLDFLERSAAKYKVDYEFHRDLAH
jgi:hypothetical protein